MTTIATAAGSLPSFDAKAGADAAGLSLSVVDDLCAIATEWRALERGAVTSPYGRHDWIAAYAATAGAGETIRVVAGRDRDGHLAFLLPVSLSRQLGLTVAGPVGGKHANFNLPVLRPDVAAALTPGSARALLRRAGRCLGADLCTWPNAPRTWNGWANPFTAGAASAPSDAWSLRLEPDDESTLSRSMSPDARKKLRNKFRGLAKLGPANVFQASDAAQVDAILDAFFAQKEQRFAELGIADPFADEGMRAFIRQGALDGVERDEAAIELYGLSVAGRIVAVLGGAADRHRLSGMFVSFEPGPAAKFSPGDLLVTNVIRAQCRRGRAVFDLGVGDARYKRSICDTVEELADVAVPVSLRGVVQGALRSTLVGAKRRIKRSPRLMGAVTRARTALATVRGAGKSAGT